MRLPRFIAAAALVLTLLIVLGHPWSPGDRAPRFGGQYAVLPMRFSHDDHAGQACHDCHHEFVDRRSGPPCMTCHVTDRTVAARLQQQFHDLCQGCHTETLHAGRDSGPTRQCRACHAPDHDF